MVKIANIFDMMDHSASSLQAKQMKKRIIASCFPSIPLVSYMFLPLVFKKCDKGSRGATGQPKGLVTILGLKNIILVPYFFLFIW